MSAIPETKTQDTCGAPLDVLLGEYKDSLSEMQSRLDSSDKVVRYKEILQREDIELILLRFLIGKGGDVNVAWDAFTKSMEWRDEHHADQVLDHEDPNLEEHVPFRKEFKAVHPELNFHGYSNKGLPVAFQLKGRIDIFGLVKTLTPEQYGQHLAYMLINENRYMNKLSRQHNKLLATCLVMCCKKISTNHLKYVPYFKYDVDWSQLNCPELLGEAIVINTPWFFNMIWQIVKPWLDKRTLEKVHILGGANSERELQNLIDKKTIPVALGGEDPAPGLQIPDPMKGMRTEDIGAGKKYEIEVAASAENQSIAWKFLPTAKDIGFSAVFISANGEETSVAEYARFTATGEVFEGSFVSSAAGRLKLMWDNSYSYWTGKRIMLLVTEFEDIKV